MPAARRPTEASLSAWVSWSRVSDIWLVIVLKAWARWLSSWCPSTLMAVVRSPLATRRVPSMSASTGRTTSLRLSHQMMRLLQAMASTAKLAITLRPLAISRSASAMETFTSSTPSTRWEAEWAWQSAV